ncbi:hypothetical protein ACQ3I4_03675 [Zafaria sp. Z1313]|uniref:hypothetical protein n=1 Tax=Zafaria sp. Z1313 TaxID=3423202 RepID=UPI003D3027FC
MTRRPVPESFEAVGVRTVPSAALGAVAAALFLAVCVPAALAQASRFGGASLAFSLGAAGTAAALAVWIPHHLTTLPVLALLVAAYLGLSPAPGWLLPVVVLVLHTVLVLLGARSTAPASARFTTAALAALLRAAWPVQAGAQALGVLAIAAGVLPRGGIAGTAAGLGAALVAVGAAYAAVRIGRRAGGP